MSEKSIKCMGCGAVLTAETEDALVKKVQAHGKEQHNMDMPESQIREMIRKEGT
jgi:predicted small metal-binding protein